MNILKLTFKIISYLLLIYWFLMNYYKEISNNSLNDSCDNSLNNSCNKSFDSNDYETKVNNNFMNNFSTNFVKFFNLFFTFAYKFMFIYIIIGMITCIIVEIFMIIIMKYKCNEFLQNSSIGNVYSSILSSSILCGFTWPILVIYGLFLVIEMLCEYFFKYINQIYGTNYTIRFPEFSYVFPNLFSQNSNQFRSDMTWTNDFNEIHRDPEYGPAVIKADGTIIYYENGEIHRDYTLGPAYVGSDGTVKYYDHGRISRPSEEGPAIIHPDGTIYYCLYNKYHRPLNEGPAILNEETELIEYWLNGVKIESPQEWEAAKIIQKNWRIALFNKKYREMLTKVLLVPENHDSEVGKLFPKGGKDYQKIIEELKQSGMIS